ncbi:MAG: hypothetical protein ABJM80_19065 [Sulfitobacter pontiacus]
MWPTPKKSFLNPPTGEALELRRHMKRGVPLSEAVARQMWPTPKKMDGRSAGPGTKDETLLRRHQSGWGLNLPETVQMETRKLWPTPQKSDNRDRGNLSSPSVQRRKRIGKQLGLSQVVSDQSGALNPTWVEWLMGFPSGWTDLEG